MAIDLTALKDLPRLLIDVQLRPIQGARFQPTGFPDLGAATYQAGTQSCILLESAQSMANRLENTIWDDGSNELIATAKGLSYVRVNENNQYLTSSIIESHRINSPYILESKDKTFFETLKNSLGVQDNRPINRKLFAETILRYDVNALLHGLFLAKKDLAGGRLRIARALSSFIEAEDYQVAASGGVKNDHINPSGKTNDGFGNVPFSREEYTAKKITAYFNLDLSQIRSYGLGDNAEKMLILLALYKIRALLESHLRLRTACDLEVDENAPNSGICIRRPNNFDLPSLAELKAELPKAIESCREHFTDPIITTVNYVAS